MGTNARVVKMPPPEPLVLGPEHIRKLHRLYGQAEDARDPVTGCMPWPMTSHGRNGPVFRVGRRTVLAHKLVWMLIMMQPLPDESRVVRTCGTHECVNEDHLGLAPSTKYSSGMCQRGHRLSPDNVLIPKDGKRRCRKCRIASNASSRRRMVELRKAEG